MTAHGEPENQEPQAPLLPPTAPGLSAPADSAAELDEDEKYPWGRPAPRSIQLFVLANCIGALVAAAVLIYLGSR